MSSSSKLKCVPSRGFFMGALFASMAILTGCGGSNNNDDSADSISNDGIILASTLVADMRGLALADPITQESCTLSNGSQSTCYRVTVNGFPSNQATLGPFCPETINSSAADGGTWFDNGVLYNLNGDFIENLAVFYNDNTWQLFDPATGQVNITETQAACEAAAQPQVPAEFNNFCVECDINFYGGGVEASYLIPVTPEFTASPGSVGNNDVGVSINGVVFAPPAPTSNILAAYTIAAFDDCVGHVNPVAGYHYHGANGCSDGAAEGDGHAPVIGYALDGFAIYAMEDTSGNEATDLDACRGHSDATRGYHYHSAGPGENTFIGCFSGATAQ